jgi:hypothetical protein
MQQHHAPIAMTAWREIRHMASMSDEMFVVGFQRRWLPEKARDAH